MHSVVAADAARASASILRCWVLPVVRLFKQGSFLRPVPVRLCLLLLSVAWASFAHAAPDTPATMLLGGTLQAGSGPGTTTPGRGDQVLAFSLADGQFIGGGPVAADGRSYILALMRTVSWNGTPIVLELQQGRARYALLMADGAAPGGTAWLRFLGRTLPDRINLPLRVGVKTADLSDAELAGERPQRLSRTAALPCVPEADVNGDGRCDAADLEILGLYAGGVTRTVGRP